MPDDDKPDDAPDEQEQALESLDVMMEALATVTAKMQGLEGAELHRHVNRAKDQVHKLVEATQREQRDVEARRAAADEVERLIDTVVKTGTVAGRAIQKKRGAITNTFRGVELDKFAEGLRVFADWLRHPTTETQAEVEQLISQLESTMGSSRDADAEREAAEQKARIAQTVRNSLDKIFGPKKPTS